jgi:hypothetical protein
MAVINSSNTVINNMPNIDVSASATATAATATATLTPAANRTNVITGFDVSFSAPPTTAGTVTLTNLGSGNYVYTIPVSTTNSTPLDIQFSAPSVNSAGAGAANVLTCTTLGAGIVSTINLYGYQI